MSTRLHSPSSSSSSSYYIEELERVTTRLEKMKLDKLQTEDVDADVDAKPTFETHGSQGSFFASDSSNNEEYQDATNENGGGEENNKLAGRRFRTICVAIAVVVLASLVVIIIPAVLVSKKRRNERAIARAAIAQDIPTVSPAPSESSVPSDMPSLLPSSTPSSAPTTSLRPSLSPTDSARPSQVPSVSPTDRPSTSPSVEPSGNPTPVPTPIPPTPPISRNLDFWLKMHWKREYYWQETYDEFRYCMECTTCDGLQDNDIGENCYDTGGSCNNGDQLWVRTCGWDSALFNVRNHEGFDLIKIEGKNLCIERIRKRYLVLKPCDEDEIEQRWEPITVDKPFDLRPPGRAYPDRCITQDHHPKSYVSLDTLCNHNTRDQKQDAAFFLGIHWFLSNFAYLTLFFVQELLSMQSCDNAAYRHDTALWDAW